MINTVIFDMGEVLIHFDPQMFLDRYALSEADRTLLLREIFQSLQWVMMDRGTMTEERMLQIVYPRIPERLHKTACGLIMEWDRPIVPVEGMQQLVRDLKKAGYRLYLLSNASARQHTYWPQIPGSDCFDDTLISADLHLVKPQPEIYKAAIDKFSVMPEECVFIDDNPLNVEGAVNAGMAGIIFHQDIRELREKLLQTGVRC